MRIVALVPGGIDDQILFFPTLSVLKQAYPMAELDIVVEPRSKGAYRVCQSISETILFDFKDRNSPADWANLLGVIRDRYYDIAISSSSSWSIGLLLWLTGTPKRIGYDVGVGKLFFTDLVQLKTEQYAAHQYHDLLKPLNLEIPCPNININLLRSDIDWADAERARLKINDSGYVLICNNSNTFATEQDLSSTYPVDCWITIIQDLQNKQPDLPVVFVDGENDAESLASLIKGCPGIRITQPNDVGKLAAIIAGSNLMLCTNGVPMHLGVALNVYTLALFGSTNPSNELPLGEQFQSIKSPTNKIADISPESILKVVWGG